MFDEIKNQVKTLIFMGENHKMILPYNILYSQMLNLHGINLDVVAKMRDKVNGRFLLFHWGYGLDADDNVFMFEKPKEKPSEHDKQLVDTVRGRNDKEEKAFEQPLEDLTALEQAYLSVQFQLRYAVIDLTNFDAVDIGYINNENIRKFKAKINHTLRNIPSLKDMTEATWSQIFGLSDELKTINDSIQGIRAAIIPGKDAPANKIIIENCQVGRLDSRIWADEMSAKRRNEQIKNGEIDPLWNKTKFTTNAPNYFSCSFCLTNEHPNDECPRGRIKCICCRSFGHMSYNCKYNQCAHCGIYGHGRPNCPNKHLPSRCFKCGDYTHQARNCDQKEVSFCWICGDDHKMTSCDQYDGSCYKHFGDHLYDNCPDVVEKK